MGTTQEPTAPPEAKLINQRRKAQIPRMSHQRAADLAQQLTGAGFSASAWGKIESGAMRGRADRIATMAMVVGVTADELTAVGRQDAARLLHEDVQRRAGADPALAGLDVTVTPEAVLQVILQGLDEIRSHSGLTDDQKKAVEASLIRSVLQTVSTQIDHIRTVLDATGERSSGGGR
ncbi:hypothetical protein [Streptosporangium saharense]|uniref:hypothetical protein n=1 Tax=Streptosporangium saharense TaxID=1706840 RepID=UPI00343868D5